MTIVRKYYSPKQFISRGNNWKEFNNERLYARYTLTKRQLDLEYSNKSASGFSLR